MDSQALKTFAISLSKEFNLDIKKVSKFVDDFCKKDKSEKISFSCNNKDNEYVFQELFDHLEKLQDESKDISRIYFSGEGDSNQTQFEIASNKFELGVISSSKRVALVLLRFLRMIIDDNDMLWVDIQDKYDNYDKDFSLTVEEIVDCYVDQESTYLNSFDLNETFKNTLIPNIIGGKKITISKKIYQVDDIWTITRIREAYFDKFI
jgi:hypothetical protein